ncbi:fatty acyl-CoA reductase 2-like [Diabrotica undecimpunctata]|uniref:fatty acyl-CoA reductase 2-like n=1 Tax=Diabrotica undecimpunctata TaxID=50387 RepID=UPI003B642246
MAGSTELSEIQHYYRNKSFLITGVTGFVGKLVLEKILRTLHPKNVYVLVRDKDGVSAENRCATMFDSVVFEQLQRVDNQFFKKVILVEGDLQKPDLGLSINDKNTIINEVECIFHFAAASKLNESFANAVNINIGGIVSLMKLAKIMQKLETFVFLSSVFSNFPEYEIKEEFYESKLLAEEVLDSVQQGDLVRFNSLQMKLSEDWPNAYPATLNIVEDFIRREAKGLPVCVIRPSLLLPAESEPVTGYVENVNGLYGDTVKYAMGVNKVNYYKSGVLDAVPVDYVVNLSIAAGWYTGLQKNRLKRGDINSIGVSIYHCISSQEKPITIDEWLGAVHTETREIPSVKMINLPTQFNTSCYYNYVLLTFLLHTCLAFICDVGLKLIGKPPSTMKIYKIIHETQELFSPYLHKEWYFSNENTQRLLKRLSFKDRTLFNFDIAILNWQSYIVNYVKGVRVYLIKDPMSTITEGKKIQRQKLINQIIFAFITTIILYLVGKFVLFRIFFT